MAKPKVVSLFEQTRFSTLFPGIQILGREGHLFLECYTYDLQIPVSMPQASPLNIFEETVLRMLSLRLHTAEELAERLCLPKDLINRILLQLQGKGFLEDVYTLSERGKRQLSLRAAREVTYQTAKLFCLPRTGQPMPYLHLGELSYADVVDYRSGIKVEFGPPSNPYTVSGKYIPIPAKRDAQPPRLSMKACRQAIRVYDRLAAARGWPNVVPVRDYAIDISRGEPVYFHLQAAVQQGNVDDMLVSDGFVSNIDGLADYIREESPQLLAAIRESSAEYRLKTGADAPPVQRYHKLGQRYRELQETIPTALAELEEEALCTDASHQVRANRKKSLLKCGQFLEWAFYYYTREHPVSSQMRQQLEGSSAAENQQLLMELLCKTGLSSAPGCAYLFAGVDRSRIHSIYQEKLPVPTLQVCLSFAVAEAAEHGGSPLSRLGGEDPELLSFLNAFARKYAELRHDLQPDCAGWDPKKTADRCIRIAAALLPDFAPEGGESLHDIPDRNFSESRLSARVALERQMGTIFFSSLSEACQDEWISVSPDKGGDQLPEPCHYIGILYRLLQQAVCDALASGCRQTPLPKKAEILQKARDNWGSPLPDSLNRVSEYYLHQAMQGGKSTLGAVSAALLFTAEADMIARLKEADFADLAGNLTRLRGHGNNVALWLEEAELNCLRDKTMKISKILGGF